MGAEQRRFAALAGAEGGTEFTHWVELPSMREARRDMGVAPMKGGGIFVAGGFGDDRKARLREPCGARRRSVLRVVSLRSVSVLQTGP